MGNLAGPARRILLKIPEVEEQVVDQFAVLLDNLEVLAVAGASMAQNPTVPVVGAPPSNPRYFRIAGEANNANQWQNAGYFQYSDNGTTLVTQIDNAGYIFNEQGSDIDFKIEGDGDATLFVLDAGSDVIAMGGAVDASYKLKVHGGLSVSGTTGLRLVSTADQTNTIDLVPANSTNVDVLEFKAMRTNKPIAFAVIPNGTSEQAKISFHNDPSASDYGSMFFEVNGATAYISPQNVGSPGSTVINLKIGTGTGVSDTWTTVSFETTDVDINDGILSVQAEGDSDVGIKFARASATGRAQMGFYRENESTQIWRYGITSAGGTSLAWFDQTQNVIAMAQDGDLAFNPGGQTGVGLAAPTGKLHVDQASSTGGIPVLTLDQGDVSEQAILISYSGADVDMILIDVDVTGDPQFGWIEASDMFSLNKGLIVDGSADIVQLTVQAHSTQNENILEIQDSNSALLLSVDGTGDMDMQENAITNFDQIAMKSAVEATISSGAITITEGHIKVDTEADAANDDLDTITSSQAGEILFLLPEHDDRTVRIRDGVGNIFLKHQVESKSYTFSSPVGSSGTFYIAGEYMWPTTDSNLTQASTTQTLGTANISYASHASLVAAGAGTATGGSGAVTIVVSGTSIDDEANRSAADSETIVSDITAMSTDEYFETTKKWIGQITYTLTVGATGHTAYAADFNYGFTKYEDFGNQAFSITNLECVGLSGGSDSGFNIRLFYHNSADWTYAASGFVPGPTAGDGSELANMNTDHSTEQDLTNGEPFAYKRTDLNQDVAGNDSEGIIIEVTTAANKAVEIMDLHVGVHTAPNFSYLATTKQHLIFMKHGSNWLEL